MNINQSENSEHLHTGLSRRTMLGLSAVAATGLLLAPGVLAASGKRRVVVWSEGTASKDEGSKKVYPEDINTAVAEGLKPLADWEIITASLDDPDQGLSEERLQGTAVLIWWGHKRHGDVKRELVNRINTRVREEGMGFIGLHSAHFSRSRSRS